MRVEEFLPRHIISLVTQLLCFAVSLWDVEVWGSEFSNHTPGACCKGRERARVAVVYSRRRPHLQEARWEDV
jgi:hypothetical protein